MKEYDSIKTLTLTVKDLYKIVAEAASGNTEAATNLIATKISEKADRLRKQREKRRLRKQQLAESQSKAKATASPRPNKIVITVTRERAQTLLWLHNHADQLKTNLIQLTKIASPLLPSSTSAKTLIETLALLTRLASDAHPQLRTYLSSPSRTATLQLHL